jgi:hypothetical protein
MMPDVSHPDFKALLPRTGSGLRRSGTIISGSSIQRIPTQYQIHHNQGKHPAEHVTHGQLRKVHHHPETIHGYAYKIHGGWRITDDEHRPVNDPHVVEKVIKALRVSD